MGRETDIAWRPDRTLIERSHLSAFLRKHSLGSLEELQQRSIADPSWFWEAILTDLDIRFRTPYASVLDMSRGPAWAQWCPGGVMNIIDNCLDKYAGTPVDSQCAIKWEREEGEHGQLSYCDLRRDVNRMANALRELGLGRGDRIGVFMPMTSEVVVAMLAILKIGAIFLPLFSGFGAQAVASRLQDAEAKALFTADGCARRGRAVPLKTVADEAAQQVPTLASMIVFRRLGLDVPWQKGRDHWWKDLTGRAGDAAHTESTGADDPMMILYTSGTTGRPKGAVHSHCGFPVKAAQDIRQGFDLQPGETLYWMTDMGWMMGPWLVFGALLLGSTLMVYDGAPDFPGPDRLWSMVDRHQITTLGLSPTLVRALLKYGDRPLKGHSLASLQKFGSTGEPWNPEPWLWLFNVVGQGRRPILNYSGGTEISGGIVGGNVITPLKPCSFSGPLPGMAADVVDEQGLSVRGQVGELVLRRPWIGMTRGFWRDPDRYLATYWSRWPGIWWHGDWAKVDTDGLWYILGRSDDTIKIAGKRVGPAEVESALVGHPAVSEAAVIGVPDELKGQALACFCVLKPGHQPGEDLRRELRDRVIQALGKSMAPGLIAFVEDLPRTRNMKIMRRVVRAAHLGEDPGDISSLENPAAIEAIRKAR